MKLVGNSKAIRSVEFHKQKLMERWVKGVLLALLFTALVVVPTLILRSEKLLIQKFEISGNLVTRSEEMEALLSEYLSGSHLFFIPKKSSVLLNRSKIEQGLLSQIPRLSLAKVSLKDLNTLEVLVEEREPFALYCEDFQDLDNPSGCYFLDESGYLFSEAPDFSGGVYMVYAKEPILETPLRTQLIDAESLKEVSEFVNNLPKLGFTPKVLVEKGDEYALILSTGTEIKWKLTQNLRSLASDFELLLQKPEAKEIIFGDLLYIDLRIDNRIRWLPK